MKNIFSGLIDALRPGPAKRKNPFVKEPIGKKKSGKTRRGAVHIQGRVFRSRPITAIKLKLPGSLSPKQIFVSPAQYRRLHLGRRNKDGS